MSFLDLSRTRYSVRKFVDTPVEQEKLDAILEAGRISPTATNAQPVVVYVLKSAEALAKLDSVTRMRYGAPVALLVCVDTDRVWKNGRETFFEGYNSGEMDGSIVCDEMMLAATELGLGTLWARGYDSADFIRVFELPENILPVCLLDVGYAAEDSVPSPKHTDRKPMEEFAIEL